MEEDDVLSCVLKSNLTVNKCVEAQRGGQLLQTPQIEERDHCIVPHVDVKKLYHYREITVL